MIEWCFMLLSTVFQSNHGDNSHYSCLSWVSQVLGWALKCLAQGQSLEKTQRIQCSLNPGPLDYKSNTSPLGHGGPSQCKIKEMTVGILDATFILQMTRKLIRVFVLIESWTSLNSGHLRP